MENPNSFLSKTISAKIANIKEMEGSSLPIVLIANVIMCQSKELKCDSKFLKVCLLWVWRLCVVQGSSFGAFSLLSPDGCVGRWGTGSIGTSCNLLLRAKRTSGHIEEPLCCSSGTALLGLSKCITQCVCIFLYPAMYTSIQYTTHVCIYATYWCLSMAGDGVCILDALWYCESPGPGAICTGYTTEVVHSLKKYKSRRKVSISVGFPSPR